MSVARALGLSHSFGSHSVLQDIDLDINAGEVLGLIGPNGGGKSTLLLLFAGLLRPSSGSVSVDGTTATEIALRQRGAVGLLTADAGLYPLLSGWENLIWFGGLYDLDADEVSARLAPTLESLDLGPHLHRQAGALSTGQRQKLSLARALLLSPKLLLLDEPTANLDPASSHLLHCQLRAAADRGVAVVLCTHDLSAAGTICDRVAVLQGSIRAVERLSGERAPPSVGPLLALYQRALSP